MFFDGRQGRGLLGGRWHPDTARSSAFLPLTGEESADSQGTAATLMAQEMLECLVWDPSALPAIVSSAEWNCISKQRLNLEQRQATPGTNARGSQQLCTFGDCRGRSTMWRERVGLCTRANTHTQITHSSQAATTSGKQRQTFSQQPHQRKRTPSLLVAMLTCRMERQERRSCHRRASGHAQRRRILSTPTCFCRVNLALQW